MTYDPTRPVRQQLTELNMDALRQRPSWWRRVTALLRRMPSTLARMGGYWGGIFARPLAFLRRR